MVAPQQSNEPTQGVQQPLAAPDEDEFSLLDLMIALGEGKRWLFLCCVIGACIGLALVWDVTRTYTAKATIMPPGGSSSAASSAGGQLQMLATLGGINLGALTGASEKNIIALMNSDRLANIVIDEFALKTRWKLASDVLARDRLKKAIKVTLDKNTGFIDVGFTDADPVFAAQVANGLVTGLRKLTGEIALGEAQQKRMILEEQIDKARDVMIRAEFNLRALDQKLGVKTYDSRGELALAQATSIRGQLIALEVQQQSMRTYANDKHPDMLTLNAQIAALRSQLTKLEDASGVRSARIFDGTAVPNAQQVEHAKAVSEARHRASTYEALIRQLEFARAEEARQGMGLIQQIDKAVPPEAPNPTGRRDKVLLTTGMGFAIGLILALLSHFYRRAKENPESNQKMAALIRAWSFRSLAR